MSDVDLVKDVIVKVDCPGPADCGVPSHRHIQEPGSYFSHYLTVLDAEVLDGIPGAVCVSESGEQCTLFKVGSLAARVVPGAAWTRNPNS